MKTIHKLTLQMGAGSNTFSVPKNSKIIKLGISNGLPAMWYIFDSIEEYNEHENIKIFCIYTGDSFIDNYDENKKVEYLDTIILQEDELVLHYFKEND